ncbi:hypothetical protein PHYSODRAFT_341702 [Phytophthora sojae]|uniref:HAT C-terminal dimerisation domain-containing protein n=1 Tax=Phytophthora sojae (strain P6497) TaxID=1094619 RepID=G5AE38_PHYSP|nr:hypothetical protein PHYSODRAFT_341702 [Phytophthora sojae]EGZ06440.1 hypothetical protein PHYSODRAFT_341702 [Phytophthora sojae]|eukprot:XP_009538337.1 hypothetical protein PHYSODRAFT_341702 [Phytophthora sojae]
MTRKLSSSGGYTNMIDHLRRDHQTAYLSKYEIRAVRSRNLASFVATAVDEPSHDFVESAMQFVDLRWIPPTSNDVERLFSRKGPTTTLETLVMLEFNGSFGTLRL